MLEDRPTSKGVSAQSDASFNSTGGTNTEVANKNGFYTATLPGLTGRDGNPQVTGIHLSSEDGGYYPRCKLGAFGPGASSTSVNVQCYDKLGAIHNSGFFLAYSVGQGLGVVSGQTMTSAWAWANGLKSTNVYTPDVQYQYNGFSTGHLTAQKTGTGLYTVTIPGTISYSSSVALVSARGPGNSYCNLAGPWTTNAISVACYGQGGIPTDSEFEISFQTKS